MEVCRHRSTECGSFLLNSRGVGVVLRNHRCHFFHAISNPDLTEILACKRAVQLAMEMDVLVVELDSKGVVSMLNCPERTSLILVR